MDVETNIRNWRSALVARETLRAEDLDELEDHLRQELDELRALQRGEKPALSDAEAFTIAQQRLGGTTELAAEFAKADPNAAWRRRWIWMLIGYIGISCAITLITTLSNLIAHLVAPSSLSGLRGPVYASMTCVGLAALYPLARAAASRRITRYVQGARTRRLESVSGIVLFMFFVLVTRALITPLYSRYFVSTGVGSYEPVSRNFMLASSVTLWLAPLVALAIVLWLDRSRSANAEDSAADSR